MGYRASTLLNPGPDKYLPVVPTLRLGFFSCGDCFGLEITKRNASGNRRGRDLHPTMLPPTGLLNSSTARIPVDPLNATELGIE
jgi:hypothetical protein